MPTHLHVKTEVFEGPLDLLLELIEKRKLLINDVSLAAVTDEYIERISGQAMPVGETAEFVALAATLLLIKSRSLLPTLELSPDESRDIKELEYRLAVYQIIKEAAKQVDSALQQHPPLYEGIAPAAEPMFLFDASISKESLRTSIQSVMDSFPTTISLPKVAVKKIVSIEEMIEKMASRVSTAFRMSFREFSAESASGEGKTAAEVKHGVIVSFLALLELVKQGILKAHQGEHFSDITLESDDVSTPTYE